MNLIAVQEMVDRVATKFNPRRVILFGSHATGTATEQSDVDLLVVSDDGSEARDQALAIRRSLADFEVGCDIIVTPAPEYDRYRRVVNHIVYLADRYGKVVYER